MQPAGARPGGTRPKRKEMPGWSDCAERKERKEEATTSEEKERQIEAKRSDGVGRSAENKGSRVRHPQAEDAVESCFPQEKRCGWRR